MTKSTVWPEFTTFFLDIWIRWKLSVTSKGAGQLKRIYHIKNYSIVSQDMRKILVVTSYLHSGLKTVSWTQKLLLILIFNSMALDIEQSLLREYIFNRICYNADFEESWIYA